MQSYGIINLIKVGLNSKSAVEVSISHKKILVERVEKEGIYKYRFHLHPHGFPKVHFYIK